MRAFDECSDSLFSAPELGNFDLNSGASKSYFLFENMQPYTMVIMNIRQTTIGQHIKC